MIKEDLNRIYGDPDRQKPILPPHLLAAAHLIREYCNNPEVGCPKCIFHNDKINCCVLFCPIDWELSSAEHKTADWIDKQYFQGRELYTDTDTAE